MGIKMSKNLEEAMKKNVESVNGNNYFKVAGDLDDGSILKKSTNLKNSLIEKKNIILKKISEKKKINIDSIHDTDELLRELFKCNSLIMNEMRDKKFVANFLEKRKNGDMSYMYSYFENSELDLGYVYKNTFNDNGGGMQISGNAKVLSLEEKNNRWEFDYRITMKNSTNITTEEAVVFINTLVSEANKRGLNLRAKNYWESDAFILYCDKEDLFGAVKLLEDLTDSNKFGEVVSNATKHFGPVQPFSATLSDESYYGIAMAHSEPAYGSNGRMKGMGVAVSTFNEYINNGLNRAYDILYKKYNGNVDMITIDEVYRELVKYHKNYMFGNEDKDIPLWMNRRNYTEYMMANSEEKTYDFSIDGIKKGR